MTIATSPTSHLLPSDSDLIGLAAAGDGKAFNQLVRRYLPMVYNYLYRMTGNHEVSEEMAQEAFVKAYKNLKGFDRARPFKPWILRIASNAAVSELRKQSKVVSLNALEEDGHWQEADFGRGEDTVTVLERKLASEEVMRGISKLDEKYRQVLLLRYQHDFSYEEISETMQVPLNTVRTWLKRGLDKLKYQVKEMAGP
jgi:RNA polymerase sigma-70 factor, ECF subfamily